MFAASLESHSIAGIGSFTRKTRAKGRMSNIIFCFIVIFPEMFLSCILSILDL